MWSQRSAHLGGSKLFPTAPPWAVVSSASRSSPTISSSRSVLHEPRCDSKESRNFGSGEQGQTSASRRRIAPARLCLGDVPFHDCEGSAADGLQSFGLLVTLATMTLSPAVSSNPVRWKDSETVAPGRAAPLGAPPKMGPGRRVGTLPEQLEDSAQGLQTKAPRTRRQQDSVKVIPRASPVGRSARPPQACPAAVAVAPAEA